MITKILLGYDGSDAANRAHAFAVDLASRYGAELHILAVARPPEFGDEVESEAVIENSRRHHARILASLRSNQQADSPKCHYHVLVGHPAEQLVRYAAEQGIDHIVVGHRGHTPFERWLIGSVAKQVLAYAHCAVTIVRT